MSTKAKIKPKKATLDHLQKRKPPTTTIILYTDDEAARQVIDLERQLQQARFAGEPEPVIDGITLDLERAIEARDESAVSILFRSCGRKVYDRLIEENPPTAEQVAEFQEATLVEDPSNPDGPKVPTTDRPQYNPETFPSVLIMHTMVDPKVDSVEQLDEILGMWNETEYMQLWMAAMTVCSATRVGYWGKG